MPYEWPTKQESNILLLFYTTPIRYSDVMAGVGLSTWQLYEPIYIFNRPYQHICVYSFMSPFLACQCRFTLNLIS